MKPIPKIAQVVRDLKTVDVIQSHDNVTVRLDNKAKLLFSVTFLCPDPYKESEIRSETIVNAIKDEFTEHIINFTRHDYSGVTCTICPR